MLLECVCVVVVYMDAKKKKTLPQFAKLEKLCFALLEFVGIVQNQRPRCSLSVVRFLMAD